MSHAVGLSLILLVLLESTASYCSFRPRSGQRICAKVGMSFSIMNSILCLIMDPTLGKTLGSSLSLTLGIDPVFPFRFDYDFHSGFDSKLDHSFDSRLLPPPPPAPWGCHGDSAATAAQGHGKEPWSTVCPFPQFLPRRSLGRAITAPRRS